MNIHELRGCGTALVTPFRNGQVDYDAFAALVDYQIKGGVDFLVPLGTTGETPCLTDEEKIKALTIAKEHSCGKPVVAGVGTNSLEHTIANIRLLEPHGVDVFLVVVPYYNKPPQEGMYQYYKAVAASTCKPIILYNVPGRTGMTIKPETYVELAKHERIVATKEACGDISMIQQVAALCGDNLTIYSGNDDQILPIMALGGKGVISVLSHVAPRATHDIARKYLDGDVIGSRNLQLEYLDLCNALFCDVNPIPVKEAMNMCGWNVGRCRMPLGQMDDATKAVLYNALAKHGLAK